MINSFNFERAGRLATAFVALILAACAAQQVHREGVALLEQGKYEEAVSKLEEATRKAPDDMAYRTDLRRTREQVAGRLLMEANAERVAERFDSATRILERVLRIDPSNARARVGLETVAIDRHHAAAVAEAQAQFKKNDYEGAKEILKNVLLENPNNGPALLLQRQINETQAKLVAAGPALQSRFKKPVTLQFRDANLKLIFESLSKTSGINILLDKDVKGDLKSSIFVKDASVEDTIDLILLQNQLEKKVLSDNTVFIYPNTPAKSKDFQDLKVRSFHLVNADAKQMQTMIKTILKTKDLFIHEKTNSLIMRDTPEAIRLAERMIADQDVADPEVMLEVEVLEVTHERLSSLGILYPDSFSLSTPGGTTGSGTGATSGLTLGQLKNLSSNSLLATPLSATLNLKLQDTDVNLLASPRIRARNKEKAKILIGDRVPIITNSVTPVSTGTPVVTGTVQYLEVGLKLEVEPDIHSDGEVGIKISLEVSNIVNQVTNPQSGSVAYQIGTRTASTVLRLKDGETQVLAGLINDEDRRSATKVPGLGQLPLLGRLFSNHDADRKKSEIILSITPRLVGKAQLPDAQSIEFWTGTETTLRNTPLTLRQGGTVAVSAGGGASTQQPATAKSTPVPHGQRGRAPAAGGDQKAPPGDAVAGAKEAKNSAGPPVAFSWQGPTQAKVGDKFTLTLMAQAGQSVTSVGVTLSYDPTVLKAVDAVEGDFVRQSNQPSSFNRDIDASAGQISIELAQSGAEGTSGTGSVASIAFEVIAAKPQSQVMVSRVTAASALGEALPFVPPAAHNIVLNP